MELSFKKISHIACEYLILIFGTFLYCMPWEWFIVPNGFSSGGVTGLCTLLQYATNGVIPVSLSYLVVNVFLLMLAFLILGKGFGIRTIFVIALSTLLFEFLSKTPVMFCCEGGLLFLPDKMLIPVIAGVIEGLGLGIVLRFGGSTGGSDIFAMILNKYWPISPGRFYMVTDAVVIALVLLLPDKHFSDVIYGYLMMVTSSLLVDFVVVGAKSSVQLLVFSEKNDQISRFIMDEMGRGVTALKSVGCYTGKEKDVLLLMIRSKELPRITEAIKAMDENAFVSVVPANSVYGEGFEQIKTGIKKLKKPMND